MLMANSAAILTDAFPANQRGMALGINQIAGISGQFVGLLLGGVLAAWDWRAVFWVNVPIGVFGTVWAYLNLREFATTRRAKIDWLGNVTFALGAGLLLVAITYGIQPYGGHPTGWTSPFVLGGLAIGIVLLVAFCFIELKIPEPMFDLRLFRIRAFTARQPGLAARRDRARRAAVHAGHLAGRDLAAAARLQLRGHAAVGGHLHAAADGGLPDRRADLRDLSDRYGQRLFATAGLLVAACAFVGLMLLPIVFPYWIFGTLIFLNGVGSGLFASPNTSAIMSSVRRTAAARPPACGPRSRTRACRCPSVSSSR